VRAEKDEASPFVSSRLDERVLTTLQGLPGRIAFSGLRRVLGAHPESLARALRRLEREGLVERTEGGYRALTGLPATGEDLTRELRPIASIDLPLSTLPDSVLARLSGRWFGALRWVGVVDRPEERLLAWARRDGSGYVLLGIHRGALRVYVPTDSSSDAAESEDAAYELLVHAADALRTPRMADATVSFLALPPADLPGGWSDN
jgi:DNA-binding HxlR family transcriptional regulator